MVKFSCFSHIQSHKNKRTLAPLVKEFQQNNSEDCNPNKSSISFHLEDKHDHSKMPEINALVSVQCSTIRGCKSEEMNRIYDRGSRSDTHKAVLKKSHSLGSELDQEGITSCNYKEDVLDKLYLDAYASEDSGFAEEIRGQEEVIFNGRKKPTFIQEAIHVETHIIDSITSTADTDNNEDRSQTSFSVSGCASKMDSCDPSTLMKSCSMPNIAVTAKSSSNYQRFHTNSSENISLVGITAGDNAVRVSLQVTHGREIVDVSNNNNNNGLCTESAMEDGFGHCDKVGPVNNWGIQKLHDVNTTQNYKGESSGVLSAPLPSNEFKKKRIKDWIMGLQNFSPSEEINQSSQNDDDSSLDSNAMANVSMARNDSGMDAAKKYISCLSATATTSQLSNSGLVIIPFMSTFSGLKVLNLSGNAIVRITSGALPHGLHVLNLSKNNISMIEGLRELKRLRILDLSYNRILRIGHGLASCSSMKELYLAGNKISEVEGLHRLLKLNVLDLRFNKIATSRCLGQLAPNYISLQALSLEGNPAQKNIGDEQIRKQLHDLLPHLVYYNRHPIKATALKDTTADRSTRTGSVSYQFDRAHRSEKLSRKNTHGFTAHKSSFMPVSTHGHKIQAPNNVSKVRQRHLHHNGTPTVTPKQMNTQNFEFSSRTPGLETDLLMRRSQSEGTIGTT